MSNSDNLQKENRSPQRGESATNTSRVSGQIVPERQTIESIVAEGDDERWQLARKTARAVFWEPALVTPRCLALLGEQGIAAFVDEVRALARGLIRQERAQQAGSSTTGSGSENAPEQRPAADAPRQPKKLRRPAPLGLLQPQEVSKAEVVKRRLQMSKSTKAFISDAVFGSIIAAVALALGLFALRFAPLIF